MNKTSFEYSEAMIETTTRIAHDFFGNDATTAVALCALLARDEGMDREFAFWLTVLEEIEASEVGSGVIPSDYDN
jgi:hypothetical protein